MRYDYSFSIKRKNNYYFSATEDELKYIKKYIDSIEEDTWDRINKCPLRR